MDVPLVYPGTVTSRFHSNSDSILFLRLKSQWKSDKNDVANLSHGCVWLIGYYIPHFLPCSLFVFASLISLKCPIRALLLVTDLFCPSSNSWFCPESEVWTLWPNHAPFLSIERRFQCIVENMGQFAPAHWNQTYLPPLPRDLPPPWLQALWEI